MVCLAAGLAACDQAVVVERRSKLASGAGGDELLRSGGRGRHRRRFDRRLGRQRREQPAGGSGATGGSGAATGGVGLSGGGGTFSVAGSGGGGCVSNGCAPPLNPCYSNTCNLTTGLCDVGYADGVICDDGNQCTQGERCASGVCGGGTPRSCPAPDQCHDVGACTNGVCSNPLKQNGTACNDQNACTQTDTCQSGDCIGGNPRDVPGDRSVPRRRHLQHGHRRVLDPDQGQRHGVQRSERLLADRHLPERRVHRRQPGDVHGARSVPRRRHLQPVDRDLLEPQQDQRRAVQRRARVHDGRQVRRRHLHGHRDVPGARPVSHRGDLRRARRLHGAAQAERLRVQRHQPVHVAGRVHERHLQGRPPPSPAPRPISATTRASATTTPASAATPSSRPGPRATTACRARTATRATPPAPAPARPSSAPATSSTIRECDGTATCKITPRPGAECDDNNPCTTGDVRRGDGTCAGTPYTCDVTACLSGRASATARAAASRPRSRTARRATRIRASARRTIAARAACASAIPARWRA